MSLRKGFEAQRVLFTPWANMRGYERQVFPIVIKIFKYKEKLK